METSPTFRGVAGRASRTARRHWRALLLVGIAVFIPLGLIETIDHELADVELDNLSDAEAWAVAGAGLTTAFTALLGEIFFAGVVAAAVSETHGGRAPSMGELVRSIPFGTLIAIDILTALAVAFGFVLLIVPGILVLGYFGLAAPVAKIEHLGVRAAFRRSRQLVRGRLGLVLLILIPVALGGQLLSAGVAAGLTEVLGESFTSEWLAAALSELVSTPAWALAAVALTYELLEARSASA